MKYPANIDYLVAGLGNPGSKYTGTRHNIGRMVITELASRFGCEMKNHWGMYQYCHTKARDKEIFMVQPDLFMNRSGEAVAPLMKKLKLSLEKLIVISDEYNFPLGKVHLRLGGGDGGHNGVCSVIEELGSSGFIRLRCGIGRNFGENGLTEYVLSKFSNDEISLRDITVSKAAGSIEFLLKAGLSRAMSEINSESLWEKSGDE